MKRQVATDTIRSPTRLGYVFGAPLVLLVAVYVLLVLGASTEWVRGRVTALLGDVLPGTIAFDYLEVDRTLTTAQVFGIRILDPEGTPVIVARRASCRVLPAQLARNTLAFDRCVVERADVLVHETSGGSIGIADAFDETHSERTPDEEGGLRVEFVGVTLLDVDVLVAVPPLNLVFRDIDLHGGEVLVGSVLEINAGRLRARGGRAVLGEDLFGLGDGKPDWATVAWLVELRQKPWRAMSRALPPQPETGGLLDLPVERVSIDDYRWRGRDVTFGALDVVLDDMRLAASGWLDYDPPEHTVPDAEDPVLRYDGRLRVDVTPTSRILRFFLGDLLGVPTTPESGRPRIEPLLIDGHGTVRFFQGGTRLRLSDVTLLGWPIRELDAGLRVDHGMVHLDPGSRVRIWGGEVRGEGWLRTLDGVWELGLCGTGLDVPAIVQPFAEVADPELQALLKARLRVGGGGCVPSGADAMKLWGDLTTRALERAPAFTTPADKELIAPMLRVWAPAMELEWGSTPPWLPASRATVQLAGTLDPRGIATMVDEGGQPGVRVRVGGEEVTFSGGVDTWVPGIRGGRVAVRATRAGTWLRRFGVEGLPDALSVTVSAAVDGDLDALRIDRGRFLASHGAGGVLPPFRVESSWRIDGDALVLPDLSVASGPSRATASGRLLLFDGDPFTLRSTPQVEADVQLERLGLDVDVGDSFVTANVGGSARVEGALAGPTAVGELLATSIVAFGEPIDIVQTSFEVGPSRLSLSEFHLVKGKGHARGHLALDFVGRTIDAELWGRRFRLSEVRTFRENALDLEGGARFDLAAAGSWDSPDVSGSLIVEGLRLGGRRIGGTALVFKSFDGVIEAHGDLAGGLDLEGRFPLDGGPSSLVARFHRLSLEQHVPSLAEALDASSLSGVLSVTLDPFGTGEYGADLTTTELRLRLGGRTLQSEGPFQVMWRARPTDAGLSQRVVVDGFSIGAGGRYVRAWGTLSDFDRLGFRVLGDLDLSLLRFLPDLIVDAEGTARVSLDVGGTLDRPAIDGSIEAADARIAPRGLGTSVSLDSAFIEVTSEEARIRPDRPLRARIFGGEATVSGRIGLAGLLPSSAELQVFVTGLAYRIPDELNLTLNADVRYEALSLEDAETWSLVGDVSVIDARYHRDFDVVGGRVAFGGIGRGAETFEAPIWVRNPTVGALRTDLRITGRDRFLVESRVASAELLLELQTDLHLVGRLRAMELSGEVKTLEGSRVVYQTRPFEVRRAVVGFDGTRDADGYPTPTLDAELNASIRPCTPQRSATLDTSIDPGSLSAVGTVEPVLVRVLVDGRVPSGIRFQLESTPFYDPRDQLSLIVTGCTLDQLTAQSAGAPTLDLVFRPVIDAVERNVEQRLNFDDVNLVPTADGTAAIQIEDELTSRLTWRMNATVGAGADSRQVARVEYRVVDWLIVEIQEETSAERRLSLDGGVRLRFRLD